MDDLISRKAAIDALQKEIDKVIPPFNDVVGSIRCGVRLARNIIEDLQSAQPEIIRCAVCKWFQCNMRPDGCLPKGVEEFECRHWRGPCDPVDFCSFAERRADE